MEGEWGDLKLNKGYHYKHCIEIYWYHPLKRNVAKSLKINGANFLLLEHLLNMKKNKKIKQNKNNKLKKTINKYKKAL